MQMHLEPPFIDPGVCWHVDEGDGGDGGCRHAVRWLVYVLNILKKTLTD